MFKFDKGDKLSSASGAEAETGISVSGTERAVSMWWIQK